jgi:hypothetical protein
MKIIKHIILIILALALLKYFFEIDILEWFSPTKIKEGMEWVKSLFT